MARGTTDALLSVFDVAGDDGAALKAALVLGWNDFEHAVTAAVARRANCDAIITRNARDFKGSPVRVLTRRRRPRAAAPNGRAGPVNPRCAHDIDKRVASCR